MSIAEYWPRLEEIDNCIKPEAESVHESVLLSVHQPLPMLKKPTNRQHVIETTEAELLKEFLTSNLPTGTLLIPITGSSGSGKSHMIRWLHAQLIRTDESGQRMHIIRIPKSASLRSVVEKILQPLNGEAYDGLCHEFQKAVDEVSPENAVIQFRAGLEIALKDYANQLKAEMYSTPKGQLERLQATLGHSLKLPGLFKDPALSEHFDTHVLRRIVERAVVGRTEIVGNGDKEVLPQFSEEDLILPPDISPNDAATSIRNYYLGPLNVPEQKELAVVVLNKVIDEAVRITFNLNQNLGGLTLQDIILEIRKQLLEEGKELILLIEDFAALTGIQETLLNICIQEAVRDGERKFCNMRTAVAVTDGYLTGKDTILTRAQYEWAIKSELSSDQEIVARATDLVGAYANAARYGDHRLRLMFEESNAMSEHSNDLTAWIKPFHIDQLDDATETVLKAFGTTERGFHLFPLNTLAIQELAKRHLMSGGKMIFNPRLIINRIIRDVLLLRDLYERNSFPPPRFNDTTATMDVAGELSRRRLEPGERERYESFICFWGGNPSDLNQLSVPPQMFEAFGLKPLVGSISPTPLEPLPHPEPPKPEPTLDDPRIKRWQDVLEKWVSGIPLGQVDANTIRQALVRAVGNFTNWNAHHLKKPDIRHTLFWIANAAGNPVGDRVIRVVETASDPDGRIRKSFLSLIRYDLKGKSWNYPEANEDAVYYAILLEDVSHKVVEFYTMDAELQLIPIIQGLAAGGLILGLSPPSRNKDAGKLTDTLLSKPPGAPRQGLDEKWDHLRNDCYTLWEQLQWEFLRRTACFQGDSGHTPYAIDTERISRVISKIELYSDIELSRLAKELSQNQQMRNVLQQLSAIRLRPIVLPLFESLKEWYQKVLDGFGKDFDKDAMLTTLKEVTGMAKKEGNLWPKEFADDSQVLNEKINSFRKLSVKEVIGQVAKLDYEFDPTHLPEIVYVIARIDPSVVMETRDFIKTFESFFEGLERRVQDQLLTFQGGDLATAKEGILNGFKNLEGKLAKFAEGTDVVS